jgi:FlaA1/EpsC-like NDP-sugar epimerase
MRKLQDLLIVIAIGLFIGFLAPYGMHRVPLSTSLMFWVTVCLVGYGIYAPFIFLAEKYLVKSVLRHWHRVAIGAIFASFPMSLVVSLIILLFFERQINLTQDFVNNFYKTLVIGGVISLISLVKDALFEQKQLLASAQANQPNLAAQQLEQFMALLPLDKRGNLYCLVSEDHYLKVYTDKGHHLILMRLKDAIAMLSEYPGYQTHRSWWVSAEAVRSSIKQDRKILLNLVNNVQVLI